MKKTTLILLLVFLPSCIAEKTTVGKLCTKIKTNPKLIQDYAKGKMFKIPLFFFDLTFLPDGNQEWIGKDPTGKTYATIAITTRTT